MIMQGPLLKYDYEFQDSNSRALYQEKALLSMRLCVTVQVTHMPQSWPWSPPPARQKLEMKNSRLHHENSWRQMVTCFFHRGDLYNHNHNSPCHKLRPGGDTLSFNHDVIALSNMENRGSERVRNFSKGTWARVSQILEPAPRTTVCSTEVSPYPTSKLEGEGKFWWPLETLTDSSLG